MGFRCSGQWSNDLCPILSERFRVRRYVRGAFCRRAKLILALDISTKDKPSFLQAGSPHSTSSALLVNFSEGFSAATSPTGSAARRQSHSVSSSAPAALSDKSSLPAKEASSVPKSSSVSAWASILPSDLSAAPRSHQSSSAVSQQQASISASPSANSSPTASSKASASVLTAGLTEVLSRSSCSSPHFSPSAYSSRLNPPGGSSVRAGWKTLANRCASFTAQTSTSTSNSEPSKPRSKRNSQPSKAAGSTASAARI
jgi:hypothetical protein